MTDTPITVYTCFETLLYFPIYHALITLGYCKEEMHNAIVPCGGDLNAFLSLSKHDTESDSIAFAVCDPVQACLNGNRESPVVVVQSLIDRAAVWGVAFDEATKKKIKRGDFSGIYVSTYGEDTTSYRLFEYHLIRSANTAAKPSYWKTTFGQHEFEPLIGVPHLKRPPAQLALTIEPWRAITQLRQLSPELDIVYFMPPRYFFFTGLLTRRTYLEDAKSRERITDFLKSVRHSVESAYNDPDPIVSDLFSKTRFGDTYDKDIIKRSVEEMLERRIFPPAGLVYKESFEHAVRTAKGDLRVISDVVDTQLVDDPYL